MSSYQAHVIKDLPSPIGEANFSEESLKTRNHSKSKVLKELTYLNWEQLSNRVSEYSNGKFYLARPSQASEIDLEICLERGPYEVLSRAMRLQKFRKNGRENKIINAIENNDFYTIAAILASSVSSYWQDKGYFGTKNSKLNRNIAAQIRNNEKNEFKSEIIHLQIEKLGVVLEFKKAKKKGPIQACIDFEETQRVLENIDFED